MKLNKIYYINLLERTDRLFFCERQLYSIQLPSERVDAVKHKNGRIGCALSHLKILEKIYEEKEEGYFLILEDDFFFKEDIDFEKCILKMKEYNSPVFCLSYNYEKRQNLDKNYIRILKSFSTCAYIIYSDFIPELIGNFKKAILEKKAIDVQWNELQKEYIFIGYKYPLILQLPSFSNITKKDTFINENFYIILEPNLNDIGMFLFEFSILLDLSIRSKKFFFIQNWNIYNPFFKMSFFPPKKLKRKNEVPIYNYTENLESGKNYIFKRGFLKKINFLPNHNISYFLKINQNLFFQNTIAINIYFHNENDLIDLSKTNYFKKGLQMIQRNNPNSDIHIYTNKINLLKKIWGKPYSYFLSNNDIETITKLIHYKILILGNDSISWWSGYLNKFTEKEVFFPKEWNSIRKEPPFPFYSNITFFSIYNITYIIFDFSKEKINKRILDLSIPLIIVTPYPEKFSETYNIIIKPISRKICTYSSIFREKDDNEIYEMEKLKIIYNIIYENPYHTIYFASLSSHILNDKSIFIDSKNYYFNNEKYLYKDKIKFITFSKLENKEKDSMMISTKKSIQEIHDKYYQTLHKTREIPDNFFHPYHFSYFSKSFQYQYLILLLFIPFLMIVLFLLQR